ncbi:MAG: aminopeptidase [Candidatus Sericytochromatia bacterium]|nr:aminopeptidase [Candidatus Tanganyikabacteria bacterium]
MLKQEPIDKAAERLSHEQAGKLRLVREIKAFAIREIGLRESKSYETFVNLDGAALSHVVSAAHRDRLEGYLWHFPIVGAVPYKGFFERADAEAEQARLERAGFDTHLRAVAAFSLLGFLADPFYSSMLSYGTESLANIVIHELTHATVFLPGNPVFNESFATYVGNRGSVEFLAARFGADSPEVRAARDHEHDDRLFGEFIAKALSRLREYYARADLSPEGKLAGRDALFEAARAEYSRLPFRRPGHRNFAGARLNNAYFLLFDTYQRDLSRFERIAGRFPSLPAMVRFFRDEVASQKDPEAFLATWEAAPRPTSGGASPGP